MTVYETFCGIGGFSLGFKRAGFEIIGGCEIDPYARAVYEKNFGIKPDGDIRSIESIPADIICGGFPCQDISNANPNGKGLDGERSGLWWELARIIKNSSPRYVVLENVSALLSNGMGDILRFFSEVGYDVEWDCLRAKDFGASHLRDRLWIVAYSNSNRDFTEKRRRETTQKKISGVDRSENSAIWELIRTSRWEVKPAVGGGAYGIPNRIHRIKCLGNAIVPQISQWIAERIKEIESLPPSDNEKG